ncbi:MAG: NAD(P)/FAD-dependent oxidoreductase [Alphaproteobacteria bacterium]
MQKRVAVVGAGVVGICCALQLRRDGHAVTVYDPEAPGTQTSFGNAGAISSQSCIPMSGPGILKKVPGWLMDPLGPLAIRMAYLPRVAPWLARFVAAGRRERVLEQVKALRALHTPALDAHRDLAALAGAGGLIQQNGGLYVYETGAAFAADAGNRALMRAHGVELHELDAHELRQMEPALAPIFRHAVFLPTGAHTLDPGGLVQAYAAALQREGGEIRREKVLGFATGADGVTALRTDAGERPADAFVIAAGAWSHRLAAQIGDKVPLESERGYHMVVGQQAVPTRRPVSFIERRFMATTMNMGLRLAGTVEFAGLDAPPNWGRSEKLLEHAKRAFADLTVEEPSRWMGHRPATPDSLPVIGRAPKAANVLYAFGHGHLGLTGGAITGRMIADLVADRPPAVDPAPYSAARF